MRKSIVVDIYVIKIDKDREVFNLDNKVFSKNFKKGSYLLTNDRYSEVKNKSV